MPAVRKARIGPDRTVWNTSLVKGILQNEKYIGKLIWNKTTQLINPITENVETRKNPPEEWIRKEAPALRIVDDGLWSRVQERLKIVNEQMTASRLGGLNRAKRRDYLFSGLLTCGACGSRISITSSHKDSRSTSYSCVSYRYRRGCDNNLYIKESRLTEQLVDALAKNLLVPEVMEHFINTVHVELDNYLKQTVRAEEVIGETGMPTKVELVEGGDIRDASVADQLRAEYGKAKSLYKSIGSGGLPVYRICGKFWIEPHEAGKWVRESRGRMEALIRKPD